MIINLFFIPEVLLSLGVMIIILIDLFLQNYKAVTFKLVQLLLIASAYYSINGQISLTHDSYDLSEDPQDPPFLHVQSLCKVILKTPKNEIQGKGVLEQLFLGPHEPSGFKDLFDKP